jgi:hypothetical protein
MEKKSISRSAFLSFRALIALLLCASACFIAMGTVPAFLRPEAREGFPPKNSDLCRAHVVSVSD